MEVPSFHLVNNLRAPIRLLTTPTGRDTLRMEIDRVVVGAVDLVEGREASLPRSPESDPAQLAGDSGIHFTMNGEMKDPIVPAIEISQELAKLTYKPDPVRAPEFDMNGEPVH